MNWQSKTPYLAALCVLIFAISTLYLVAVEIKKSFDAELERSTVETENISIALEQSLVTKLGHVALIQNLAANHIDLSINSISATTLDNKASEELNRFLKYSNIISAIGIINEENALVATASLSNTYFPDFPATIQPANQSNSIQIIEYKKDIFLFQKINHSNNMIFFSKIDNARLAETINTFNKNNKLSISLIDKSGHIMALSSGSKNPQYDIKKAAAFIQSAKNSVSLISHADGKIMCSHIRKIGDTPLYLTVSSIHSNHLESWQRNAKIYVLSSLLIFALILQIIYYIWRSKRFNQSLALKENKLIASETRFRQMIEAMPIGLILARLSDNLIMYINQPAAHILDLPQASALSKRAFDFYQNSTDFNQQVHELNKSKSSHNIECLLKKNNGDTFWASVSISLVQGADTQTLLIGIVDISERKKLEAELKQQATIDHLSGLFNRAHFIASANTEIQRIQRNRKNASLLMLDIDHFKRVNDNYGHDVGDLVIRIIAKTCKASLREVDIVGRLGGEEFAALLPETSLDVALQIAERLRCSIENQAIMLSNGQHIRITSSIGVTEVDHNDEIIDIALKRADLAMYTSKNNGRNQVQSL